MLNNKTHIDNLFAEGLKDFEKSPDPSVWQEINSNLDQSRRRRRGFILWPMAASLALIFSFASGYILSKGDLWQDSGQVVDNISAKNDKVLPSDPVNANNSDYKVISNSTSQNALAQIDNNMFKNEGAVSRETVIVKEDKRVDDKLKWLPNIDNNRSALLASVIGNTQLCMELHSVKGNETPVDVRSMDDQRILFNKMMLAQNTPSKDSKKRWTLMGQVSSEYASASANSHNSLDYASSSNSYEEQQRGIWSMGAGVKVNVQTGKKISLQTGVYFSRMGQTSVKSGLMAMAAESDANTYLMAARSGNTLRTAAGLVKVKGGARPQFLSSKEYSGPSDKSIEAVALGASLTQHFETVEVPLLVRYNLVDRKVGIHLLGGVSTNWIVGNRVYLDDGNQNQYIGETAEIQTTNFSSQLGVGFEYGLSSRFKISLEPSFKYYLHSISKNSQFNYRPYSVGFYTGISYKF